MDAEKTLTELLNNELMGEVLKEVCLELEFEEDTDEFFNIVNDRLISEWYRKSNRWTNEMIHNFPPSL